jgi:ubiquitin carboxyl-terminal hydrolase 5/13
LPQFNEAALAQLQGMGFPLVRCQKALLATGNNNAEAAMEWLFMHMDDPGSLIFFLGCTKRSKTGPALDIDAPIQAAHRSETSPEPSVDDISLLTDMGFTTAQARKALRETVSRRCSLRSPHF